MFLCVCVFFKCHVFVVENVQNYNYDAFLMGKDPICWTERVFCSSIIDFIWFVSDGASYLNGYCSLMYFNACFNVYIKVKKHVFVFFLNLQMF